MVAGMVDGMQVVVVGMEDDAGVVDGMVDGRPVVVVGMEDGAGCGCRDGRW